MIKIKPQKDFPYYKDYERNFPITKDTIFVFDKFIYTDNKDNIPYDVWHHEIKHLQQQNDIGAANWIQKYLTDDNFRLEQELEAYKYQLEMVKQEGDKQELFNIRTECARNLSSPLYGGLISYKKAFKLLDV